MIMIIFGVYAVIAAIVFMVRYDKPYSSYDQCLTVAVLWPLYLMGYIILFMFKSAPRYLKEDFSHFLNEFKDKY